MQTCKMCGDNKPLVRSHIIPRSFYELEAFRQKAPQKALSILSDSEELKPIRRPVGIYDSQLFCEDCEKIFMEYDNYAFKLLYENRKLRKTMRGKDGQVLGEYYESYDYEKLKLFFLGVLLRAGLSEDFFFQHVTLGPYLDVLKRTVGTGKALPPNDFAIFLEYYREAFSGPVIFPPAPHQIENVKFYYFHLGRVNFQVKLDKQKPPSDLIPIILKPGAWLLLIRTELCSSHAYEVLKKITGNRANLKYFST